MPDIRISCSSRFALALPLLISACASPIPAEMVGPKAAEEIVAVSTSHHLLRFNAGQPQLVRDRRPLQGLVANERLLGIDYRVARGELFALGASGQLYRIDVAQALAMPVGAPSVLPAGGIGWGVDFNPTVDRIRVVSASGENLRLHPDTGATVDSDATLPGTQIDGRLAYDAADVRFGQAPRIVGAAYTYDKTNDKLTTNYALDGAAGSLAHQGSMVGRTPAVSPNTGRLYTVGTLGTGGFVEATFDISDVSNTAYAGLQATLSASTRWYRVDLTTGSATFIGTVGGGEALVGAVIEP